MRRNFEVSTENIAHIDDQAASGIASLKDPVELLHQLLAQLLLLALRLFRSLSCALNLSLSGFTFARRGDYI